jgi:hypothetical protein
LFGIFWVGAATRSENMAIRVVHLEDERDLREGMALVMEVEAPQVDLTQFSGSDTLIPYIDSNCGDIDLFIEHIRNIGCEAVIVITSAFDAPPVSVQENLRIHYFRKPWDLPESIVQMLALTSK